MLIITSHLGDDDARRHHCQKTNAGTDSSAYVAFRLRNYAVPCAWNASHIIFHELVSAKFAHSFQE